MRTSRLGLQYFEGERWPMICCPGSRMHLGLGLGRLNGNLE